MNGRATTRGVFKAYAFFVFLFLVSHKKKKNMPVGKQHRPWNLFYRCTERTFAFHIYSFNELLQPMNQHVQSNITIMVNGRKSITTVC